MHYELIFTDIKCHLFLNISHNLFVMYSVVEYSLAACGHVGVATRAGGVLFVTRRDTCVRACRQYS